MMRAAGRLAAPLLAPLLLAVGVGEAAAQAQVTLRADDGGTANMWRLTSPNAGPGDWVGVGYTPPYEYPFRVVSAQMYFLDSSCCLNTSCFDFLCSAGQIDWQRLVIARENTSVDSAGLTPEVTAPIAQVLDAQVAGPGSSSAGGPWSFGAMQPIQWTLPANTIFDSPGRVFFVAKYVPGDQNMNFATDTALSSGGAGVSIFTSNDFSTRAALWTFGDIGMRVVVAPIYSLKRSATPVAPEFATAGQTSVPMLAFRVAAGEAAQRITSLRLTPSGTGHDGTGVANVRLVVDQNANGVFDPGEPQLASGRFTGDDAALTLSLDRTLPAATAERWLVVYDLASTPIGGQTFAVRVAAASHVTGTPYLSGAIAGTAVTIAGRLFVERGPRSMGARVVAAGTRDLAVLQVRLRAENEPFTVDRLAFRASGSLHDSTGLTDVRLVRDVDGDGQLSAPDVRVAPATPTGASFPTDDGRLSLSFSPLAVPANTTVDLLLVASLTAVAAGGDTFRAVVGTTDDVGAQGQFSGPVPVSGPRALGGLPAIGEYATVGGALTLTLGPATPTSTTAQPTASAVPMIQLALTAAAEAVEIGRLRVRASGTGDEPLHVARVRLWRDANQNGLVDAGDVALGSPSSFASDDGELVFAFPVETIPVSATRAWLVTYDLAGTASGGETFRLSVPDAASLDARGADSGAPIVATGAFPLVGVTRAMLGGFSIVFGPRHPAARNVQPGAPGVPMMQLGLSAQGEAFTVRSLRLTAGGALDDASSVTRVALWRDLDGDGSPDAGSSPIATARFAADDGTAVLTPIPPVGLARGRNETWLLTYDLGTGARPGESFRAALASAAAIEVTGSLSGPTTPLGLPLTGPTHAIGGTLSLAAGPRSPLGGTLAPDATGVVASQVRLSAGLEPIDVGAVTVTARGTGNDLDGLVGVSLWVDTNGDGQLDPLGDVRLAGPLPFPANDGAVTLRFGPRSLAAGGREDWLLVLDLSGRAVAGETFGVAILGPQDVEATAPSGRLPAVDGVPLEGPSLTVLGRLALSVAPRSPLARVEQPGPLTPLLALRLRAEAERFDVDGLVVGTAGRLDEAAELDGLALWHDVDSDGAIGPADRPLSGLLPLPSDDGAAVFTGLGWVSPPGDVSDWLIVTRVRSDATPGGTVRVRVEATGLSATGFGARLVTPAGLPIGSPTLTVGGGLRVSAGPENPSGGTLAADALAAPMLQIRLQAETEAVTTSSIALVAAGSGDDARGVAAVRLWLDADRDGRVDPVGDVLLAGPASWPSDDGRLVLTFPPRVLAAGATEDWLVAVDLAGTATAGQSFSVSMDGADALGARTPSGPILAARGAPITGALRTVLGRLELSAATTAPRARTVARGSVDVPMLAIDARGVQEAFRVDRLVVRAAGSIDDVDELRSISLIEDRDASGTRTPGDRVLAGPSRFTGDDGAVSWTGIGLQVPRGGVARWLVVVDLAGDVPGGRTLRLRLDDPADLGVTGLGGRVVDDVVGLPLSSSQLTTGGALRVSVGPAAPIGGVVRRGDLGVPALLVRLDTDVEVAELLRLRLDASGSGDDARALARVAVFHDVDADGRVGPGEPQLDDGRFAADDGALELDVGRRVSPGAPVHLLVRVDVDAAAVGGTTHRLTLEPSALVLTSSTGAVRAVGPRLDGPELVAGGGFAVALGPQSSPGFGVHQAFQGVPALQLELRADNEVCTVEAVEISAAGSIDDAADVTAVRLVRDVNENGLADFSDALIGAPAIFGADDGVARFAGLNHRIARDGAERWLVVYDLSGSASDQETLRARLADPADVEVRCDVSGLVVPAGGPIEGGIFRIEEEGAMTVRLGADTPQPRHHPRGAVRVAAVQLRLAALVHDLDVDRLTLTASTGALAPGAILGRVSLFRDVNQDGRLDRGDRHLADGAAFDAGGGTELVPTGLRVAVGEPVYLLAVADVSPTAPPGARFTLGLARDSDLQARAAAGPVRTSGAPAAGQPMTVAGDLDLSLGSTTATLTVVANDAQALVALDLVLAAESERFTVESLTLSAEGDLDPANDIASVALVADLDGDGVPGPSEPRIVREARFAQGASRLPLAGLSERIEPGRPARWLVVLELAGRARVDQSLSLGLAANVDLTAVGDRVGPISPTGAPLRGPSFVVGRSLTVAAGPAAPADAIVAADAEGVPLLQLELRAANEDVTLTWFTLHARGSLDDVSGLRAARLFADLDGNGRVDPTDAEVAPPARSTGDDGTLSFRPLSERIGRNDRLVLLVVADLTGAGVAGQDLWLSLDGDEDLTAFGARSGAVSASGAPVRGARLSLVGALNVRLGGASPLGAGVKPGSSFPALQLELFTQGETVRVRRLQLRLRGSADDASSVALLRLWRDTDGDGAVSEADARLAEARPEADDALVRLDGFDLNVAAGARDRVLVEVELSEAAEPGGTLRLALEERDHVEAEGTTSGAILAVGPPLEGSSFTVVRPAAQTAEAPTDEGCGCATTTPAGSPTGLWLGLLGLLALRRRRG
jgi:MYXO-CTERM domain-containing protein